VERERAGATRAGKREVLLSLLELADSFDAALLHSDPESYLSAGLSALQRKLQRVLETHGVTPLSSLGDSFNPELHEALGLIETDQYPAGSVAEEVLRGYRWGDELLRPARVRIAQPAAETRAASEVS
jgi:molecular chaperone GrpE